MREPRPKTRTKPDHSYETIAHFMGYRRISGVDEAGRGPLAGPVVAAAVVMPLGCADVGVNDSKKLSPQQREKVFDLVCGMAHDYNIAVVGPDVIDEENILQATLHAMKQAVEGLRLSPDYILVDGNQRIPTRVTQQCVVHGDALCFSIAAASILAKVYRDRLMREYEEMYPGYGFAQHKGYGTREHMQRIRELGPTPIHRRSFSPVREALPGDWRHDA